MADNRSKMCGLFHDENSNLLIATYRVSEYFKDNFVLFKVVIRKNESVQLIIGHEGMLGRYGFESYVKNANITSADVIASKPVVAINEIKFEALNDSNVLNRVLGDKDYEEVIRLIEWEYLYAGRYISSYTELEDLFFDLHDVIDNNLQKEWNKFSLLDVVWLITFPKLGRFGFSIHLKSLNREMILKINAANSKEEVWQAIYPKLNEESITVLETKMPILHENMDLHEIENISTLTDDINYLSGTIFNVFENEDNLTTFIQMFNWFDEDRLNGFVWFCDEIFIFNESSLMDGIYIKKLLLPYFSNSQEHLELAIIDSFEEIIGESPSKYGFSDFLTSLETLILDISDEIETFQEIDLSRVKCGEELKKHLFNQKYKNLQELYYAISAIRLALESSDNEIIFDYSNEDEKLNDEINGYEFDLPKTSFELNLMRAEMCLGLNLYVAIDSYSGEVAANRIRIVSVKKDGEYVLFLDIRDSRIIHCKKKFNEVLNESDESMIEALIAYVQKNNLSTTNSFDFIKVSDFFHKAS